MYSISDAVMEHPYAGPNLFRVAVASACDTTVGDAFSAAAKVSSRGVMAGILGSFITKAGLRSVDKRMRAAVAVGANTWGTGSGVLTKLSMAACSNCISFRLDVVSAVMAVFGVIGAGPMSGVKLDANEDRFKC